MEITDEERASHYLSSIGYYRLSAYWYPLRQSTHDENGALRVLDAYRDNTRFCDVVDLYVFDKRLRLLLLDAIERIEVALRTDIALLLGARDPWAHLDRGQLDRRFVTPRFHGRRSVHEEWCERLAKQEARSHEDFVAHFKERYPSSPLPIWVAVELWDFGMLSYFFNGMRDPDKDVIARRYRIPRRNLLATWLRSFNFVRNTCAHHSRIWNRPIADVPAPPRAGEIPLLDHIGGDSEALRRLYAQCAFMQYLLRTVNPTSSWGERLKALMTTLPTSPHLTLESAGFMAGWDQQPLWAVAPGLQAGA